jgi:glycosyltransferase involved in cell wall biosynthesis
MRVLHGSASAFIAGTERIQAGYIRALTLEGMHSELFVYRPGPSLEDLRRVCPVHLRGKAELGELARAAGFDLVHLTANCLELGAVQHLARAGYRGPLVVSSHELFTGIVSSRNTSVLTVVSEWLADTVRPFSDVEPVVVYNGIDLARFTPRGGEEAPPRPVVAWVGCTEDPRKAFSDFMQVAASPALRGYEVWVAEAEGTAEESALSQACGLAVKVWHEVPHETMPSFYRSVGRSGGCLVSTSRFDAAPLVILEALACGCPVVAPRVGGIPEMLSGGRWGALYEPGTSPHEVATLVRRLRDGSERATYLDRAASELPDTFSIQVMVARLLRVYAMAAERPVTPRLGELDRGAVRRWHIHWGRWTHSISPTPTGRVSVFGIPSWLLRTVAVSGAKAILARVRRREEDWVRAARPLWLGVGKALGCVHDWRRSRSSAGATGRAAERGGDARTADDPVGPSPSVELVE